MTRTKKTLPVEPLKVCSVKLTPTAEHTLQQLSQDASDIVGWTVSNSAVMRALIAYVGRQTTAWAKETLFPLIEAEIVQGRVWGTKK